jgi:hypothetical protein
MPSRRSALLSLVVGVLHAALLLTVALRLGYEIGPSEYTLLGVTWRYAGLVVVAALPVWLALEHRLLTPLVALALTSGYVVGVELAPPGPTFRDVAELERLSEPTGITVVENGLYVVRYMVNATVWTFGFLLLGLVEHAVRTSWSWLPSLQWVPAVRPIPWLSIPAARSRAVAVAAAGGLMHAVVMVWFAHRLGVTVSGGVEWLLYLFGAVGMVLLAAVPLYVLVRQQLVAPTALLTAFVLLDVRAEFTASVDGPHALYFGGWFVYLALLVLAAALEYGLRQIDVRRRLSAFQ